MGKIIKLIIKKLYGGRLNDVATPNINGAKLEIIFFLNLVSSFFIKIFNY